MMINLNLNEEVLNAELEKVSAKLNELGGIEFINGINLENDIKQFQNMQGALYDVGDAFSYLGGMMGNAEGAAFKMIGTMITGINQLLPNIITLVSAKSSEAYTSAIASGAGLPFP